MLNGRLLFGCGSCCSGCTLPGAGAVTCCTATAGPPGTVTAPTGRVCTAARVATAMPPTTTAPIASPAPAPATNPRRVTTGRKCSDAASPSGRASVGPGSPLSAISTPLAPVLHADAPPGCRHSSGAPTACQIWRNLLANRVGLLELLPDGVAAT